MPLTELILMIRPLRCLTIGRCTARIKLKAPFRLVSITTSQSSLLMRMLSPSRVTPALLTRISTFPKSRKITSANSCTAEKSATSTA